MSLPQKLMQCAMMHFESGVLIDDLDLKPSQRARLARVEHVYWQWMKNPFLDVFPMFKMLVKGKYADLQSEWRAAQKDKWLFDFIVDHIAPPSRRVSEARVRAAGNHLMEMGMQTDNGRDIAEGAKIITKLDRLDQPENEQADMSKIMFLPPVVVTNVKEIDNTKEDVDDAEMKRIMAKYGGFVDEKEKDIEEMVEVMAARREAETSKQNFEERWQEDDGEAKAENKE